MITSSSHLIPPHGGELVDLTVQPDVARELKGRSREWPSWDLTPRQLCDLELLLSGGFSPLRGFMNRADYEGVCNNMRLSSGLLWPMPLTLDVTEDFAKSLNPGSSKIALRNPEGVMLAAIGIIVGAIAGFALSRLAISYFADIRIPDATPVAGSVLVLLAAAVIASALPAARAARVDVMQALRSE